MEEISDMIHKLELAIREAHLGAVALQSDSLDPPFPSEVCFHVEEKQREAADLLERAHRKLYAFYCETEKSAKKLIQVKEKEVQLSSAKKVMKRYFDTHTKLQEEQKEYYEECLRFERIKASHMVEGCGESLVRHRNHSLLQHVLQKWRNKTREKHWEREKNEFIGSKEEFLDTVAETYRKIKGKRQVFSEWHSLVRLRRDRAARESAVELEKKVEFFQAQALEAQKTLSEHLNQEHSKSLFLSDARAKECEVLDDEVERLKTVIEELTDEFGERCQTYVRQQEELQSFFNMKEERLRGQVIQLQQELEGERRYWSKRFEEYEDLLQGVLPQYSSVGEIVLHSCMEKDMVIMESFTAMSSDLVRQNAALRASVLRLESSVETLSPLSGRVALLTSEVRKYEKRHQENKNEIHNLKKRLIADSAAAELARSTGLKQCQRERLSGLFWQWMCWTRQKQLACLTAKNEALTSTLQLKNKESRLKEKEQASIEKELERQISTLSEALRESVEEKEQIQNELYALQEYSEKMENAESQLMGEAFYQKTELRQLKETVIQSSIRQLVTQEESHRFSIEAQEARRRLFFSSTDRAIVGRALADSLSTVKELTQTNDQWYHYCQTVEKNHEEKMAVAGRTAKEKQAEIKERAMLEKWFVLWKWHCSHKRAINEGNKKLEAALTSKKEERIRLEREYHAKVEDGNVYWKKCLDRSNEEWSERLESCEKENHELRTQVKALLSEKEHLETTLYREKERNNSLQDAIEREKRDKGTRVGEVLKYQRQLLVSESIGERLKIEMEYFAELHPLKSVECNERQGLLLYTQERASRIRETRMERDSKERVQSLLLQSKNLDALVQHVSSDAVKHCGVAYFTKWRLWCTWKRANRNQTVLKCQHEKWSHEQEKRDSLFSSYCHSKTEIWYRSVEEHVKNQIRLFNKAGQLWSEETKQLREECNRMKREVATLKRGYILSEDQISYLKMTNELQKEKIASLEAAKLECDDLLSVFTDQTQLWVCHLAAVEREFCRIYEEKMNLFETLLVRETSGLRGKSERLSSHLSEGDVVTLKKELLASDFPDEHSRMLTSPILEVFQSAAVAVLQEEQRQRELVEEEIHSARKECRTLQNRNKELEKDIQRIEQFYHALEEERNCTQSKMKTVEEELKDSISANLSLKEENRNLASMNKALQAEHTQVDWQESLEALISQYQKVLHNFLFSIQERRETFYSVNGILVEVDGFSKDLMRRFEENSTQMRDYLEAAADLATNEVNVSKETEVLSSDSTPRKQEESSDERLEKAMEHATYLEKALIQAKLELAHAKEEAENAKGLRPSLDTEELEMWQEQAAADARDLDLGLTFQEILSIYLIFQEKFLSVTNALREAREAGPVDPPVAHLPTAEVVRLQSTVRSLLEQIDGNNVLHQREMASREEEYHSKESELKSEIHALKERLTLSKSEWEKNALCEIEKLKNVLCKEYEARGKDLLDQITSLLHQKEELESENVYLREQLVKPEDNEPCSVPVLFDTSDFFSLYNEKTKVALDDIIALQKKWTDGRIHELEEKLEQLETENLQLQEKVLLCQDTRKERDQETPVSEAVKEEDPALNVSKASHSDREEEVEEENTPRPCTVSPDSDRLVDSLGISQSLLRYSKLLSTQNERNSKRLNDVYALSNEVEDIMEQGSKIKSLIQKSGLL